MTMFNRSQAAALALLVATFLAGAAAGWAVQARADDRERGRRRGPDAMVGWLTRELDLSAAQQATVRRVFERHKPAMDALWREVHPRMDSLRQAMRAEIAAGLSPAQRERYRALIAEQDRRRDAGSRTSTTTTRGSN